MSKNVITINGQTVYAGSNSSVSVINNEVIIDGEVIDMQKKQHSILDLIKGDSMTRPIILNVVIQGNVESVKVTQGDVEVTGEVKKAESVHGNVSVTGDVQSVNSIHGAINVGGNVTRSINTVHGSVNVKGFKI